MSAPIRTSASFTSVVRRMLIRSELLPTAKWYYYGCPGYLEPNLYAMSIVREYLLDEFPEKWDLRGVPFDEFMSWLALLLREEMEP